MRDLANFITLSGMVLATAAAVFATEEEWELVILLMLAAVAADFIDGKIARLARKPNKLGRQLDKLADFYNFALMGGAVLWLGTGQSDWAAAGWAVFALVCARRLGQPQPEDRFIGMPIPLAWCWAALPLMAWGDDLDFGVVFMLIAAALMLSRWEFRKLGGDDIKLLGLAIAISSALAIVADSHELMVIAAFVVITGYCLIKPGRAR